METNKLSTTHSGPGEGQTVPMPGAQLFTRKVGGEQTGGAYSLFEVEAGDDRAEERSVHGGEGSDTLYGDSGKDALYAGAGDDTIHSVGDNAGDLLDCGSGTDTVQKGTDQNLDRFEDCERFVD